MNISWSPKGETIAVGNKDDLISFIDCKNYKIRLEKQFKEIDSKVSSRASRNGSCTNSGGKPWTWRKLNLSKFEVNEICWNNDGDYFFLTTGLGTLQVLSYPDVQKSSLKLFSQN